MALVAMISTLSCGDKTGNGGNAGDAGDGQAPKKAAIRQGSFPIVATFDQAQFQTMYQINIDNPDGDNITFRWSGPNCGTWTSQGDQTSKDGARSITSVMEWKHPHPPCDPTTEHKDVLVAFSISGESSGVTLICTYEGAASGQGPPCQRL